MENSSRLTTSQDSPITFPPNAFWWLGTIGFLLGIALVFVVFPSIGLIIWAFSQQMSAGQITRAATGMPAVLAQGVGEVFTVAYVLLLLPVVAKVPLSAIGYRKISNSQIAVAILGAALMYAVVTPLSYVISSLVHFKTEEAAVQVFVQAAGSQKAAFAFFGIIVAPFSEELIFRVVLFNMMRKWWGVWPAAIISSLFFGLAHSQQPWGLPMLVSLTFPLALGGLVLCWVYVKTNNAWANFITHAAFNSVTFILLLINPSLAK